MKGQLDIQARKKNTLEICKRENKESINCEKKHINSTGAVAINILGYLSQSIISPLTFICNLSGTV